MGGYGSLMYLKEKEMKELNETPVNLHESRWARVRWGHFLVSNGKMGFACEKCVFNQGIHAGFCPKKVKTLEISHSDANFMRGGR